MRKYIKIKIQVNAKIHIKQAKIIGHMQQATFFSLLSLRCSG